MITISPEMLPLLNALREKHAIYCGPADNFRVSSWNSAAGVSALTITGRFLTVAGDVVDIQERHVPNSDRSIKETVHALGEGWLLSLRVAASGASTIGQIFVRLDVIRGLTGSLTPLATLLQGTLNAVQVLAWPGSPIVSTLTGAGAIRSITGTNPAAGAEVSETVPTGARWRLAALRVTLTTSVAVANREPAIAFDDGTTIFAAIPAGAAQVASTARTYTFAAGEFRGAAGASGDTVVTIPTIWLPTGARIRTVTAGIDAADDYSAPQYLVEETLEGAA